MKRWAWEVRSEAWDAGGQENSKALAESACRRAAMKNGEALLEDDGFAWNPKLFTYVSDGTNPCTMAEVFRTQAR